MEDEILDETPVEETVEEPITVETLTTEEEGVTVNVTISQPAEVSEETLVEDEEVIEEDSTSNSTFTVTSPVVLAVAQSDDVPTVMADAVESVLGEYQRLTYTTEEYDTEGNLVSVSTEYVPGLAGLDYAWITGALLFGLLISGGLKLLGRLFG